MSFYPTFRCVRDEPEFVQKVSHLRARISRIDEIVDGLECAISRDPERCDPISGSLRAISSHEYPGASQIVLYYYVASNDLCVVVDLWAK